MATISIADNDARVQYTQAVNGLDNDPSPAATELTIDFPFFDLDDINVIKTTAAGVDTVLTRGTGTGTFTVTGTSVDDGFSGGNVKLHDTDSTATTKYTIFRDIDVERTTDFPTSGPFNISSLNTELDKIFAINQELETKVGRTMKLADSDTAATLSLPNIDTRKGTVLAFNTTTGLPEAGPEIGDVSTISAITADISTLADIEDGTDATDAIQTVAGISSNVTTVAGISSNVTTVAGISANVTTVAGNNANVTTVAGISSDVTSVAGVSSLITSDFVSDLNTLATSAFVADADALADLATELDALGDITSNITTVAGISANVTTVAGISANTTTVAGISANVTTVAGISSDVTTVAGDAADIATVAARDTDIGTVAAADTNIGTVATNISNVNSVGGSIANVNTVATNLSSVNSFGERYRVSATAPSTSLDAGDLWFDTTNNLMKVYGDSGFVNAGSSVNGTSNREDYVVGTASGTYTGSTTVFPATYDAGYVDVYLNGVKLQPADFTATNGTSVTLGSAAQTSDTVSIVGYGTFELSNFSINDANDVNTAGVTNGQVLAYNSTSSDFEPTTIASDLVDDTTPQLGGTLDTNGNAIQFGASKWTIELSTNDLIFKYNGVAKIKFASDGEIVTVDDVTAFGTI